MVLMLGKKITSDSVFKRYLNMLLAVPENSKNSVKTYANK